ncbi:unnamed protein product [Cylindrotheca closterium]|uniref:Uncharacterized protein n=1 Tax=Cylindrotheca closterium TaxID=2856 RepID=A0AAD2FCX0_9STRA|nr:unnamed protein product [Cylindrotheca closterium]
MAALNQKTIANTGDEHAKTTALDNTNKNNNHEKKVRFNDRIKAKSQILYFDPKDIPEEEVLVDKEKLWYSTQDYDEACRNEQILRTCISNNDQLCDENSENLNAQGVLTRQQSFDAGRTVQESTAAVLQEQERQERTFFDDNAWGEEFVLDSERLAQAYQEHSQEAQEEAQRRAARHEKHLIDTGDDSDDTDADSNGIAVSTDSSDDNNDGSTNSDETPSSVSSPHLFLKKSLGGAVRKLIPRPSAIFKRSSE